MRIGFYYNEDSFDMDLFDCYIMPAWHFDVSAYEGSFECCINIQSMQEMSQYHVDYYLELFNKLLKDGSGIAYISNEKDYIFQGEWNYPKNWQLLLKTRTPRSWTRNSPTEVFIKGVRSFEEENRLIDFIYALQLMEFDRNIEQHRIISDSERKRSGSELKLSNLQLELQKSQQEVHNLQLTLQKSQQEVSNLHSTLSRMPLASEQLTVEKAEESIQILYAYYHSKELSDVILLFERISKIIARLVAANLCLRHGRYRRALVHIVRVGMMDPFALLSIQTNKIIWDGLIFHWRGHQRE
jgi:hypothetical protein